MVLVESGLLLLRLWSSWQTLHVGRKALPEAEQSAKSCKSTISFRPEFLTMLHIDSASRLQNKRVHRAVSGQQSGITKLGYIPSNNPLCWLPFLLSIYLKVA